MSRFAGFGSGAADFFAAPAANDSRDWFAANRAWLEADAKAPFAALLEEGADRFGGAAKIMRQNRRTRLSKDKTPYKTAIYGMIRDDGRLMARWAMLDAEDFFAGGGRRAGAGSRDGHVGAGQADHGLAGCRGRRLTPQSASSSASAVSWVVRNSRKLAEAKPRATVLFTRSRSGFQ